MIENDFEKLDEVFSIRVYDYVNRECFISKNEYSSYEEAENAIPTLTPPSLCCGFSIVSMPKLEVNNDFKR